MFSDHKVNFPSAHLLDLGKDSYKKNIIFQALPELPPPPPGNYDHNLGTFDDFGV